MTPNSADQFNSKIANADNVAKTIVSRKRETELWAKEGLSPPPLASPAHDRIASALERIALALEKMAERAHG